MLKIVSQRWPEWWVRSACRAREGLQPKVTLKDGVA